MKIEFCRTNQIMTVLLADAQPTALGGRQVWLIHFDLPPFAAQ